MCIRDSVYIPEEGVTLKELSEDVEDLIEGFEHGKRLGLIIRNENTTEIYDTNFMVNLFEAEGGDAFDVRSAILGHLQQGGDPSPFDRIQGSRFALRCLEYLEEQSKKKKPDYAAIGLIRSRVRFTPFDEMVKLMDEENARPIEQWWLSLRPIAKMMAHRENNA